MGGNVAEWTDTFGAPNYRIIRGGGLYDHAPALSVTGQDPADPTTESHLLGIRVVYLIPEPSTALLLALGVPLLALFRRFTA